MYMNVMIHAYNYTYNYRTWLPDIHSQSTTSSNMHKKEFGKDSINYTIVSATIMKGTKVLTLGAGR